MGQSVASLVTDAMVEKAARAQWEALRDRVCVDGYELDPFEKLEPDRQEAWFAETRAGLAAVESDIIEAFGLRLERLAERAQRDVIQAIKELMRYTARASAGHNDGKESFGDAFRRLCDLRDALMTRDPDHEADGHA